MSVLNKEEHSIKMIIRGNENIYICDRCGKEVKDSDVMKINKGKNKDYAYCPECAKELYPNYKKVAKIAFMNPIMKNIMSESLTRWEKRR